jgi:hypothetical protein
MVSHQVRNDKNDIFLKATALSGSSLLIFKKYELKKRVF